MFLLTWVTVKNIFEIETENRNLIPVLTKYLVSFKQLTIHTFQL